MDYSWKYFSQVTHSKIVPVQQVSYIGVGPYFNNKLYLVWLCVVTENW